MRLAPSTLPAAMVSLSRRFQSNFVNRLANDEGNEKPAAVLVKMQIIPIVSWSLYFRK